MCLTAMQDQIYNRQQGTGQPHVYVEHIRDFPVPDISIEEQTIRIQPIEDTNTMLRNVKEKLAEHKYEVNQFIKSCYE